MRRIAAALLAAAAACAAHGAERFSFAAFGDTPYFLHEELSVPGLLASLGPAGIAFAVHVGDLKLGSTPCTDELLAGRKALLDAAPVPLVYTPGDNDWTDCHREAAGRFDPLERLGVLRRLFHGGESSLGRRTIRLERQSASARFAAYRENVRWTYGDVVFVTLNVPGSNNGRTAGADPRHEERMTANFEWLDDAVKRAEAPGAKGLAVFAHADPRFGRPARGTDAYAAYREVLRRHAAWLRKPMLLVHGDGHRYRVDQPLADRATGAPIANFTRVEVFGSPAVNWVRIDVDPASPQLFAIKPGIEPPPSP